MAQPILAEKSAETGGRDFADMVNRYQNMVYSIALHFLADASAAEELAQDVFLQLHAALPALESEEHVKFWLRKVTSHRCIDQKRRRKLPQVSLESAPEPEALSTSADPMLARRLRQLVASLPARQRLIVILSCEEEMSAAEIAVVLSMPVATVKSNLYRSLQVLREKVSRTMGGVKI